MRGDIYVDAVLRKCDALKRAGLWAPEPRVRPQAWLNNFRDDGERLIGALVLDHFVYYSDRVTDRLLLAGYRSLHDDLARGRSTLPSAPTILDRAVFTRVEGEKPNPTDSGNVFCRKARQVLGVPESRVLEPADAVLAAASGTPVVFLDDFVGSGDQFIKTWNRAYEAGSFAAVAAVAPFPAIYLCVISTADGANRIALKVPAAHLASTHTVGPEYSIRSVAPGPLAPALPTVYQDLAAILSRYSPSLVLPGYLRQRDWAEYGYHSLGTLLAFEHSVPDATVPLLWADGPSGWTPLARRT